MKKSHKNSIITVITEDDIMRLLGFALNDLDPEYKGRTYETKNDELIDKKRRDFYDNFVIIQVENVDYERYLIEIVNKNDFEDDNSLIDLSYASRFINRERVKND